jgi:hypothetical protein
MAMLSLTERVPAFRSDRKVEKATADCDSRPGKEKTALSPPRLRVSRLNSARCTSKKKFIDTGCSKSLKRTKGDMQ